MKNKLFEAAWSFNGLALTLGALGFLSGFVQLFIDVSAQISVKWLLLLGWLSLSVFLVLLKVLFELQNEERPIASFEAPIQYLPDSKIFVIRRNDNFLNSIVVGCYHQQGEIDTLACVGVVHIVQEKVIQIKVHGNFIGSYVPSALPGSLAGLIIRPVVPVEALSQFSDMSA